MPTGPSGSIISMLPIHTSSPRSIHPSNTHRSIPPDAHACRARAGGVLLCVRSGASHAAVDRGRKTHSRRQSRQGAPRAPKEGRSPSPPALSGLWACAVPWPAYCRAVGWNHKEMNRFGWLPSSRRQQPWARFSVCVSSRPARRWHRGNPRWIERDRSIAQNTLNQVDSY